MGELNVIVPAQAFTIEKAHHGDGSQMRAFLAELIDRVRRMLDIETGSLDA